MTSSKAKSVGKDSAWVVQGKARRSLLKGKSRVREEGGSTWGGQGDSWELDSVRSSGLRSCYDKN